MVCTHTSTAYMRMYFPWELFTQSYILTQTNTHKPLAFREGAGAVESHACVTWASRSEVRRNIIPTPSGTLLVTVTRVTGNEEARVERLITDQQLVGVSVVCSKPVPQSIGVGNIPIVKSGRNGLVCSLLKVNIASSLVINKDNFCELNKRANDWFPIHSSLFEQHWHTSGRCNA